MRKFFKVILTISLILSLCAGLFAQAGEDGTAVSYPEKDITLVCPFGAGGTTDTSARIMAKYLEKELGVRINVVNVTGAAGTVGANEVLNSQADGYKLLVSYAGFPIPYLLGNADFTYEDFTNVALFASMDMAIYTNSESQFKTLDDIVDYARANPGKFKFGAGLGTVAHFAALLVENNAGIDLQVVEVGGPKPKEPELLSGRVDAFFAPFGAAAQFVESGQFLVTTTFGDVRSKFTPDIPTAKEMGYDMGLLQHTGFWAPKGIPAEALDVLSAAIEKVASDPAFVEEYTNMSITATFLGPDEYRAYLAEDFAKFEEIAEKL